MTTDRTLNQILSDEETKVCETILPSQLFILHSALYQDDDSIDFRAFTRFLKKRTTEYKYTGREVLNYIDEIRDYTTDENNIKNIIKAYSDKRYITSLNDSQAEPKFHSINEFAQSYLDKKLTKAEEGKSKYDNIYMNAINKLQDYFLNSRTITRFMDAAIYIILIPSISYLFSLISNSFYAIILLVILESIKFILTLRTNNMLYIWEYIYLKFVNYSSFEKLHPEDDSYMISAKKYFSDNAISLWFR